MTRMTFEQRTEGRVMKTRVVETIEHKHRRTKYGRAWKVVIATLTKHGPDGKLRALVGTERWQASTLKHWRTSLRDFAKRHAPTGARLFMRICAKNGLVFAWHAERR